MRVASVPNDHIYVRHLSDPDRSDGVVRLGASGPARPVAGVHRSPTTMLNPEWIARNADAFDIYHLHFGFDALPLNGLVRTVEALRERGKPFVYTVHDLHNPRHYSRRSHNPALDVLVPAADALITLTPGAAREITERWGRLATVIPHPHVVDCMALQRHRPRRLRPVVGVHLKSLRGNLAPLPVLNILLTEAAIRNIELVIDVHSDVVRRGSPHHNPAVLRDLRKAATQPHVHVNVRDFSTDAQLWSYLLSLDLAVLPYQSGTYSSWLEACYDLGTKVLAPRIGFYHEQQVGVLGYRLRGDRPNLVDIRHALDRVEDAVPWRAAPEGRRTQRRAIAQAHRELYESLLISHPAAAPFAA